VDNNTFSNIKNQSKNTTQTHNSFIVNKISLAHPSEFFDWEPWIYQRNAMSEGNVSDKIGIISLVLEVRLLYLLRSFLFFSFSCYCCVFGWVPLKRYSGWKCPGFHWRSSGACTHCSVCTVTNSSRNYSFRTTEFSHTPNPNVHSGFKIPATCILFTYFMSWKILLHGVLWQTITVLWIIGFPHQ
jgi:hypothetical protein